MTEAAMNPERKRLLLKLYRKFCPGEEPLSVLMDDPRGDSIADEMERVVLANTEEAAAGVIRWWNLINQPDWRGRGVLRWVRRYRKAYTKEIGRQAAS